MHDAEFVPLDQTRVPDAVEDLVSFMQRKDLPVLIQVAIAHAQFETLHPLVDGNGRTGRALVHALLCGQGLTRLVTVPVSAGLLINVDDYFRALTAYREGNIEPIVTQFGEASFAAIANARLLVTKLRSIRDGWSDRVPTRRGPNTWRIADLLVTQPVLNAAVIADHLGISRSNVYVPLQPLIGAAVVVQSGNAR